MEFEEIKEEGLTQEARNMNTTSNLVPIGEGIVFPKPSITPEKTFKSFNYSIFNGLDREIKEATLEYDNVKDMKDTYSPSFIANKKVEAIKKAQVVKNKYLELGLSALEEAKKPTVSTKYHTSEERLLDTLTSLNSTIYASQIINLASIGDLQVLFNSNKDNEEVVNLIKYKVSSIINNTKGKEQEEAYKLKSAIYSYQISTPENAHNEELSIIGAHLRQYFRDYSTYPSNLASGSPIMKKITE